MTFILERTKIELYYHYILYTVVFTVIDFRRLLVSVERFPSRPDLLFVDPIERVGEDALNKKQKQLYFTFFELII
jgi:hypothetical protein